MMTNEKTAARGPLFQHQQAVKPLESMSEPVEVRRAAFTGKFSPRTVETLAKKPNKLSMFEVELLTAWSQP